MITGFRDERRPTISFELTGGNVLGVDGGAGCAVFRDTWCGRSLDFENWCSNLKLSYFIHHSNIIIRSLFFPIRISKKLDLCKYIIITIVKAIMCHVSRYLLLSFEIDRNCFGILENSSSNSSSFELDSYS